MSPTFYTFLHSFHKEEIARLENENDIDDVKIHSEKLCTLLTSPKK